MKGTIDQCSEKPSEEHNSQSDFSTLINQWAYIRQNPKTSEKRLADKVNIVCLHYKRKINSEFISELKAANKQTNHVNKNKETMKAERTVEFAFSFIRKHF